jgi:hypothetical protein
MLRFHVEWAEDMVWKVCQILGDYHSDSGPECGGDNVAVIWVWQHDGIDQMFIFGYESVWERLVHKPPGSRQFLDGQIRAILEQIAYPFLMNFRRPMGMEEARQCEVHQEVPQPGRIQDICVEEDPECRHESDPDLLVVGSQFVEHGEAFGMGSLLVSKQRLEADSTMSSDLPEVDLPVVKKLDQ